MRRFITASILFASLAATVRADDLFSISASNLTQTVTATGNDLIDLTDNLINAQDQFSGLSGSDFTASLNYGGLANAINFSENAAGTSATITIPSTGFTRTFTGANRAEVEDQIEDFLKKDGSSEIAKFLQTINEQTLVGVTDGNPLAVTSLISRHAFDLFGLHKSPFETDGQRAKVGHGEFRFDGSGGVFEADQFEGFVLQGSLGFSFYFSDRVALDLDSMIVYRSIEDASVFHFAPQIALPIMLIPGAGSGTLSWQLTPSASISASGSEELVSGGLLWAAQLTSSIGYQAGEWRFGMANQYGYFQGTPFGYGDFEFDTEVNQRILRNGIQVTKSFGENFFIDVSASYTKFLNRAAVQDYWTPEVGIGWRFGEKLASGLRLGYAGDFGDNFTVHGGNISLFFNY